MRLTTVFVLVAALAAPLLAEEPAVNAASGDIVKDYSTLFKMSEATKTIRGRAYLDIKLPLVVTDDAIILDPDDKTAALEPGSILDLQVGEKNGRDVWMKILIREKQGEDNRQEVDRILREPAFEQIYQLIGSSGVETENCAGRHVCTKTCAKDGLTWCCEKRCE